MLRVVPLAVLLAWCGPPSELEPELDGGAPPSGEADAGHAGAPQATVSFAKDVQRIFNLQCVSCHSGGLIDLRAPNARTSLLSTRRACASPGGQVEMNLVTPGEPEQSALWHKVGNTSRCGAEMPPGRGGLKGIDPGSFATIETWIREGAQDN